jgi:phosphate transport system substrate-binding protein
MDSQAGRAGTIGAEHSDGVATAVRDTNNSIGYVEYAYALNNNLNHGFVMNRSGQFVRADSDSISAAIPEQLPPGSRDVAYAILNPAASDAYPITALTWLLVPLAPKHQSRPVLVDFLTWTLQPDAQLQAKLHGYVGLPERLRTLGLDSIKGVR